MIKYTKTKNIHIKINKNAHKLKTFSKIHRNTQQKYNIGNSQWSVGMRGSQGVTLLQNTTKDIKYNETTLNMGHIYFLFAFLSVFKHFVDLRIFQCHPAVRY